jgi:hypothetical protein
VGGRQADQLRGGLFTTGADLALAGALCGLQVAVRRVAVTAEVGEGCDVFVAFRPEWLATYSDRLYLPRD